MTNFDEIPPELSETDQRLSAGRPAADGPTLDRVMTRAQRARSRRLPSFLSARAPHSGRRTLALATATVVAITGTSGMALAIKGGSGGGSGNTGDKFGVHPNAGSAQYCRDLTGLRKRLARLQAKLAKELAKHPEHTKKIAELRLAIQILQAQIQVCVSLL